MTFTFRCPHCGKKLSARESSVGRQRDCPDCGRLVTVPSQAEAIKPKHAQEAAPTDHHLLLMPSHGKHHEDLIDMTAMVDIVFFLLIFFMVTSMQALESVIGLPSPEASSADAASAPALADDPGFVTVTIEGDDTVWVEDQEVFGEQDLRVRLRDLRRDDPDLNGMLVVGNPDASHGTLVMVLDAGADAGMAELRFSVSEQPELLGG